MFRRLSYSIAALLLATTIAQAEEPLPKNDPNKPTLQKELEKDIQQIGTVKTENGREKEKNFFTLNVENDLFAGGQDQNYTNGVRLTYFDLSTDLPAFAHIIDDIIPTFDINKTTSIYYSVGQNLYTPKDITQVAQDPTDRPWAAFLYASAGLTSVTDNHIDTAEATIGVIGPIAFGEQVQKFVHKNISDSPKPQGWDNQLENEPGLILSWERQWPERYELETLGWVTSVVPHLGATVGNIYTYANTGISFRLSPEKSKWQDVPIRVRPATPGTGAFIVPEDTFSWYFFGGVEGRAVARNIFLDGNTFTDSYSIDKNPFVADVTAGVATTYGKTRISYAAVYRTKEFKGQDSGDIFGSISVGIRF